MSDGLGAFSALLYLVDVTRAKWILLLFWPFLLTGQDVDLWIDSLNQLSGEQALQGWDLLKTKIDHEIITNEEEFLLWYAHVNYTYKTGDFEQVIQLAHHYLSSSDSLGDQFDYPDFYNLLGSSFISLAEYDSAAYYYIEASKELKKSGQHLYAAFVDNNIGNIYMDKNDFPNAIRYLKKAMTGFLEQKDSTYLATVSANIGQTYLDMGQLDSATYFSQLAEGVGKKHKDWNGHFNGGISLALLSMEKGDSIPALDKLLKIRTNARTLANKYQHTALVLSLPLLKQQKSKQPFSSGEIQEAYNYFKNYHPRYQKSLGEELVSFYKSKGDHTKALSLLEEINLLRDSLFTSEKERIQDELLTQYEAQEKDLKIAQQKNQLFSQKRKEQRLILFLSLLTAALVILALIYFIQKKSSELKLTQFRAQREEDIFQSLIEGESRERERLAGEIHDGLANDIAASKLRLSMLTAQEDAEIDFPAILRELENDLQTLHRNTREISHNLLPKTLLQSGLQQTIKSKIDELNSLNGPQIIVRSLEYKSGKSRSFDLFIWRIFQEIIGNTLRHAQASLIAFSLVDNDQKITMKIEDDGKGMSEDDSKAFYFLRNRIQKLGGILQVDSLPQQGTNIKLEIQYD